MSPETKSSHPEVRSESQRVDIAKQVILGLTQGLPQRAHQQTVQEFLDHHPQKRKSRLDDSPAHSCHKEQIHRERLEHSCQSRPKYYELLVKYRADDKEANSLNGKKRKGPLVYLLPVYESPQDGGLAAKEDGPSHHENRQSALVLPQDLLEELREADVREARNTHPSEPATDGQPEEDEADPMADVPGEVDNSRILVPPGAKGHLEEFLTNLQLKIPTKFPHMSPEERSKYFRRAIRNKHADFWRKKKLEKKLFVSLDALTDQESKTEGGDSIPGYQGPPRQENYDAPFLKEDLEKAIQELPKDLALVALALPQADGNVSKLARMIGQPQRKTARQVEKIREHFRKRGLEP